MLYAACVLDDQRGLHSFEIGTGLLELMVSLLIDWQCSG